MNAMPPLEWLIVQAQAGDREALEAVLREVARMATPLVRRIAGDGADDVLQTVLWDVARQRAGSVAPSLSRERARAGESSPAG
jgi:DNA-directed RNA polymerase specialized sigma24 family protein